MGLAEFKGVAVREGFGGAGGFGEFVGRGNWRN